MAGQQPDQHDAHVARLIESAARGDDEAWGGLVDLYARRVFALANSRLRRPDVAEEITQSVLVTVATKLGTGGYTEQGRFESWLFRVAMNRVRDEIRRRRRQASPRDPAEFDRLDADAGTRSNGVHLAPELARLREAMETLSEADREIIELRHHAGLAFKQIADVLDEPIGTLLARHHRALRKLRAILETEPGTNPAEVAK